MRKYLLADEPPKKIAFNVPSWAFVPDDEIGHLQESCGNVSCKECKRVQSHRNKGCIHCCKHEVLQLTTDLLECKTLDIEHEVLSVMCGKCGKIYVKDEWEELFGRRLVNIKEDSA
jgi:hypothetical protein